ncbi:hypothetical protein M1512_03135 [Patescibacteria group bacterium]|nr:hypothetical protein [Patescibacteria group bacterium]
MIPKWFNQKDIPYDKMWEGDSYWLPRALTNEIITGVFYLDNQDKLLEYHIDRLLKLEIPELN